jgi:hypothetical protein
MITDFDAQLSTINPQPVPGSKLGLDATKKRPGEGFKCSGLRSSKWMKR